MTRPGRRLAVTLGVVTIAGIVVTGCGVPVDRTPAALPRSGVPFGLLRPSSSSSSTTIAPSPLTSVQIFLVASSGRLVSVTREVPAQQESLSRALQVLVKGPTSAETASGLESAVPQQTTVLGAAIGVGGIATVNLAGTFAQLVGQAQIQAVAQILFTAAALPGVGSVTFELEGKPVDVPVASGAQVRVVNPTQFTSLAPLPVLTPGG